MSEEPVNESHDSMQVVLSRFGLPDLPSLPDRSRLTNNHAWSMIRFMTNLVQRVDMMVGQAGEAQQALEDMRRRAQSIQRLSVDAQSTAVNAGEAAEGATAAAGESRRVANLALERVATMQVGASAAMEVARQTEHALTVFRAQQVDELRRLAASNDSSRLLSERDRALVMEMHRNGAAWSAMLNEQENRLVRQGSEMSALQMALRRTDLANDRALAWLQNVDASVAEVNSTVAQQHATLARLSRDHSSLALRLNESVQLHGSSVDELTREHSTLRGEQQSLRGKLVAVERQRETDAQAYERSLRDSESQMNRVFNQLVTLTELASKAAKSADAATDAAGRAASAQELARIQESMRDVRGQIDSAQTGMRERERAFKELSAKHTKEAENLAARIEAIEENATAIHRSMDTHSAALQEVRRRVRNESETNRTILQDHADAIEVHGQTLNSLSHRIEAQATPGLARQLAEVKATVNALQSPREELEQLRREVAELRQQRSAPVVRLVRQPEDAQPAQHADEPHQVVDARPPDGRSEALARQLEAMQASFDAFRREFAGSTRTADADAVAFLRDVKLYDVERYPLEIWTIAAFRRHLLSSIRDDSDPRVQKDVERHGQLMREVEDAFAAMAAAVGQSPDDPVSSLPAARIVDNALVNLLYFKARAKFGISFPVVNAKRVHSEDVDSPFQATVVADAIRELYADQRVRQAKAVLQRSAAGGDKKRGKSPTGNKRAKSPDKPGNGRAGTPRRGESGKKQH